MNAAMRLGIRALCTFAPGRAAKLAERYWFSIPRPKIAEEARRFLDTGRPFEISVDGSPVACWRWGRGPTVVLVHGWGGYGAQMSAFVEPLTRAGREVVIFDALSHGMSGPSRMGPGQATLFDFSDALVAIARETQEVSGVVAHSGGCAAVAWALVRSPALRLQRAVFIAPFGSPDRYMRIFQRTLGFNDRVMNRFRLRTEREFSFRWQDFEVPGMAARGATPPLLVIHDEGDRETAWQDGADIAAAWPNARLSTTRGLGHNRILKDPDVVKEASDFLLSA